MADREDVVTVTGRFVGGGLFEPRSKEEGKDARYSACVVLDDGENEKIDKLIMFVKKDKWGTKVPPGLQTWGVREGDDPEFEASFEIPFRFVNPNFSP